MDQMPLVTEEIDAGSLLVREFNKYAHVTVAFWLKESDDEFRYLFIASDEINDSNVGNGYVEILRLSQLIKSPFLDPFRVKLLNANDSLAIAAKKINERFPARLPTRIGGQLFGGISIDDAYVYPAESCASAT